jgi:hypothetical protein
MIPLRRCGFISVPQHKTHPVLSPFVDNGFVSVNFIAGFITFFKEKTGVAMDEDPAGVDLSSS